MNVQNALTQEELLKNKNSFKKIFFFRVCGTGMGAAACLLKEAGYEVEGADTAYFPPMSSYLETTGIPCHRLEDVDAEFLKKYDLIVVGNSVPRDSDHARLVENCGAPFASFPSILGAFILKEREVVGIAGTHGKTTTTYFLTQLLEKLGEDCGYFVGGIINGRPPARMGTSKYFVIESDEYDSAYFQKIAKFRLYELNHMLLTSLEFDHADIYSSLEDIKKEFRVCLDGISGSIIANDAYEAALSLKEEFKKLNWTVYGTSSPAGPKGIQTGSAGSSFVLEWKGEEIAFDTNIIGVHNVLNISACALFLLKEGFEVLEVARAVKELSLVKRRQEVRGAYQGAVVIDDFAHHPKAISLTVDAIQAAYPDRKVVTVFEPVSATARSSIFQKEFVQSLLSSGKVILASNPMRTTVKNSDNLDCSLLAKELNSGGVEACNCESLAQLRQQIDQWADSESVLLILSNRTCLGLWESDFVAQIS
ncbi:MAG: Mur ligase family protein [Bacteriovoracaceae bacterium]